MLTRNSQWQLKGADWNRKPYLNVGCGEFPADGFVNLDYFWRRGVDLCWDIVRSCPAPDGSLRGIFTEHCLEHISLSNCRKVLKDFHRALAPGGVLRVIVPDAGLYARLYCEAQLGAAVTFPYEERYSGRTPMMHLNRIFREHGHLYAYDFETLHRLLEESGFHHIEQQLYCQGRDPVLLLDTAERAPESLYVEAVKI
jgi:predicted SAM-dependent methyltransferase